VRAAGHDRIIVSLQPTNMETWLTPEGRSVTELQRILDDRPRPYYRAPHRRVARTTTVLRPQGTHYQALKTLSCALPGTCIYLQLRSSPLGAAMFADSHTLIQDTISRLEALAALIATESVEQPSPPSELSAEERTRKEISLSIRVLLPKLRSVGANAGDYGPPRNTVCMNCED
ncbi:MAG: hypothetical protein ABW110_08990, partial [Steroidobacteraceae bacterium]